MNDLQTGLLIASKGRWQWLGGAMAALLLVTACTSLSPPKVSTGASSSATAIDAGRSPATGFSSELATLRQREHAFNLAWHLVNDRFYDASFNGVDWEAVRLRYLPQLERVESDNAFFALLGRMLSELRDSHTRIYNARDYRNRLDSVMSTYGLRVAEVDAQVAIIQVFPDTDARRAGLHIGMVIESINGERALERLARLRSDAPPDASPERRLRGIFGRLIGGRADTLALEIRSDSGNTNGSTNGNTNGNTNGSTNGSTNGNDSGLTRFELRRADRDVPLVVSNKTLEGNIGYIAFNRFRPEGASDFGRALAKLRMTDGLIIDLRGNSGGALGSMLAIAQSFFPESRHVMTRRLRPPTNFGPENDGFGNNRAAPPEMRILATAHAYTQPVAILIDNYTASSSELLATILREQRGAAIIGRASCGCVVAVRPNGYKLAAGGALFVSESGFVSPFGTQMEGVPMQPDRGVTMTLHDLRRGIDRDVVVAQEWLRQQRAAKSSAELH